MLRDGALQRLPLGGGGDRLGGGGLEGLCPLAARGGGGSGGGGSGGGGSGGEPGALSTRQHKAIIALLNNPTIARAAEAVGVDESTLHRWLRVPAFSSAYRRARSDSFSQAVGLTQRYAGNAVQVLVKIMADPAAATASKVAAATSLLKFGREGIALDDLEERALLPLERECPGCGRLMKVVLLAGAKRDGEVL